jgi:cation:H+ antiporter
MSVGLLWFAFLIVALAIIYSGYRLTLYGDIIADRSTLGQNWVGTVLLASVTSLPELITAVTVSTLGQGDIIIGDIFGSNTFNMLIIVIIDVIVLSSIFSKIEKEHIASGIIAIALSSIFLVSFLVQYLIGRENLGWYLDFPVGIDSFLVLAGYLIGMYWLFKKQKTLSADIIKTPSGKYEHLANKKVYSMFALFGFLIIISGVAMGYIGSELATKPVEIFGLSLTLGGTMMGTIFFAIITSLPELVVTVSCVKLKAYNMAFGNVLGSNLFNLGILAVAEIFFIKGPILCHVEYNQVITIFISMLMVAMVINGIKFKTNRVLFKRLSIPSILLLLVYIIGIILSWNLNVHVN